MMEDLTTRPQEVAEDLEERENLQSGSFGESPNFMDKLVDAREEALGNTTVDLELPAYKGMLKGRYHLLHNEELQSLAKKVRKEFKKVRGQESEVMNALSADLLIACCDGLFYSDEDDQLQAITTTDGIAVCYDAYATEFFKLRMASGEPPFTSRQVVKEMFARNDISMTEHSIKLQRWMKNTSADVDFDLLGEF